MPLDPSLGAAVRLQIEATGEDVADRLRAQFEALKTTVALAQQTFASGESMYRDYAKQLREVGTEMSRLRGIADAAGVGIEGLNRSMEQAAIKAAEDFAKAATRHEQEMAKWAADTEAAVARDEAAFRREEEAFIRAEGVRRRASESFVRDAAMANAALESEARAAEAMALRQAEEMAQAAARHEHFLAGTGEFAAKGMRSANFAILNLGYAFQDLTSAGDNWGRGLAATLNNVPLLVMGAAGAMGVASSTAMAWAGGLQIAASGAMALFQNWGKIMSVFGGEAAEAAHGVEALKDRIKELEKEKVRPAVDTFELDELQKRLDKMTNDKRAFDAVMEGKTQYEKEAGTQAQGAIAEAGQAGKDLLDAVRRQILAELTNTDDILRDFAAKAEAARRRAKEAEEIAAGFEAGGETQGAVAFAAEAEAAQKEAAKFVDLAANKRQLNEEEAARRAGALVSGVGAGNEPVTRAALVRRLRRAGGGALATEIEIATPEEMQLRAENEAMMEGQASAQARQKAARQQAEAAQEAADRLAEANRPESMSPIADMAAQVADVKAGRATKLDAAYEANKERAIREGVSTYGPGQIAAVGAGSLTDAVLRGLRGGFSSAEITRVLQEITAGDLRGAGVTEYVDEIANGIVEKAITQARAGLMGRDANERQAAAIELNQRAQKLGRQQAGEGQREQREGRADFTAGVAEDIFSRGQGFNPGQARHAAAQAVAMMQQGVGYQQATMAAMLQTIHQMAAIQQHAAQNWAAMHGQMRQVHGGMINQRPNPLPMFPGN